MKTIFIMGILSFFCDISAAQPQYWGEETYDLENVAFRMTVVLRLNFLCYGQRLFNKRLSPFTPATGRSPGSTSAYALCDHIQGYAGGEKRASTASLCIGHGIHEYDCRMDERASRSN